MYPSQQIGQFSVQSKHRCDDSDGGDDDNGFKWSASCDFSRFVDKEEEEEEGEGEEEGVEGIEDMDVSVSLSKV